ncbi:MAG: hypothetical protein R2753_06670 [Chitinophagales bacterium]
MKTLMLTIRNEQIEVFRQIELEKFVKEMVEQVEEDYNEYFSKNGKLRIEKMVRSIIDFGEKYSIKKRYNIADLIVLEIEDGFLEKVENSRKLQKFLSFTFRNEDEKMDRFIDVLDKN